MKIQLVKNKIVHMGAWGFLLSRDAQIMNGKRLVMLRNTIFERNLEIRIKAIIVLNQADILVSYNKILHSTCIYTIFGTNLLARYFFTTSILHMEGINAMKLSNLSQVNKVYSRTRVRIQVSTEFQCGILFSTLPSNFYLL